MPWSCIPVKVIEIFVGQLGIKYSRRWLLPLGWVPGLRWLQSTNSKHREFKEEILTSILFTNQKQIVLEIIVDRVFFFFLILITIQTSNQPRTLYWLYRNLIIQPVQKCFQGWRAHLFARKSALSLDKSLRALGWDPRTCIVISMMLCHVIKSHQCLNVFQN